MIPYLCCCFIKDLVYTFISFNVILVFKIDDFLEMKLKSLGFCLDVFRKVISSVLIYTLLYFFLAKS